MDVGLLYSGGKDSTLAGLLLDRFGSVTCLCCTFGVTDDYEHAQAAARAVDFETRRVELDEAVAKRVIDQIVEDGYPRNGIQTVHEHALETAAALDFDAVADGTRRDDRVPTVAHSPRASRTATTCPTSRPSPASDGALSTRWSRRH